MTGSELEELHGAVRKQVRTHCKLTPENDTTLFEAMQQSHVAGLRGNHQSSQVLMVVLDTTLTAPHIGGPS